MTYLYDEAGNVRLDGQGRPMAAPIPGTDTAVERAEAQAASEKKQSNSETASDIVISSANLARKAVGRQDFGAAGTSLIGKLPWTDSAEVMRHTSVLKAQASAGNLQAMRDASKTGGALGNVTEKELKLLEDMSGALNPNSPTFLRDLDMYERTLLRTIHGKDAGDAIFEESRKSTGLDFANMSIAEIGQVDIGSLSGPDLDALEARMKELGL